MPDLTQRCKSLLMELGIDSVHQLLRVEPLSGGVASDIALIEYGDQRVCAKFALPKLRVAEDWQAPLNRNRSEYEWLRVAAKIAPESAVKLLGCSDTQHGFAMEYIAGDDVYQWKTSLLDGCKDQGEASQVGDLLGRVHAESTRSAFDTTPFENQTDFRALRLEPYLTFTATRWPSLADELNTMAQLLMESSQVLIHGDVSPKNILFRHGLPILLDAECATMGDPSFDVSFCLNHLLLKAVHLPESRQSLFESVLTFWASYATYVSWESKNDVERRICRLLPALMLARIDGKSPVEYLDEREQQFVRSLAATMIKAPLDSLKNLIQFLASQTAEGPL